MVCRRREERSDVGIRFSYGTTRILPAMHNGTRIATTGVRTGLAMTGCFSQVRRFLCWCKARRFRDGTEAVPYGLCFGAQQHFKIGAKSKILS